MDNECFEENEFITFIIVDDDGNEEEVIKCIQEGSLNLCDDKVIEDDETSSDNLPLEESSLLENIKVEIVENPTEEFGNDIFTNSPDEVDSDEAKDGESNPRRKYYTSERSSSKQSKTVHTCNICGYSSHQKSHYQRHLAKHSKPDGIFCSICREEMSGKRALSEHMDIHRCSLDPDRYQCHICDYSSKKLTNVSQHTEVHYKQKKVKLECTECDFSTTKKTLLKKHCSQHGHSKKYSKCPVCALPFENLLVRRKHIQKYINEEGKFQCPECTYTTVKFSNFKQHMVIHRSEFELEMFKCSHCPFKSKRKTDLRQHFLVKHETDKEFTFKCDFCCYVSKRGNHLSSHMKNRHSDQVIIKKCGACSYRTVSQALIDKHCSIHSRVPRHFYLCSECGESFLTIELLNSHKEIDGHNINNFDSSSHNEVTSDGSDEENDDHLEEGYSIELLPTKNDDNKMHPWYCCQIAPCDFKTTSIVDVRIHKTICHKKKGEDNSCPECTFHTKSRHLFLDHLKVHNINIEHLKPFLCDICGSRWIRKGDLTRHMYIHWGSGEKRKKISNVKPYHPESNKKLLQCSFCPYTARLRLCLYKHMRSHGKIHQRHFRELFADDQEEFDEMYEFDEIYEVNSEDYETESI